MYKIGLGQDSHKIILQKEETGKPLILGGVIIDKHIEILANSDGDVIIHSLCNAFCTAIGLGSFDTFAGPLCKKGIIDSKKYLSVVLKQVQDAGYVINNISIAIEAGYPRLEKFREQISKSLSTLCSINIENIGVAITSGDGLTRFSDKKGIQCFSIVSLVKDND